MLLVVLQAGGCALPGFAPTTVPPEQRAAYDAAMGRLPADPSGASMALEAFVETYPRSLLADDAAEQLAQLALDDGRTEDAIRWLAGILSEHPDGDRAPAARLRLARIEFDRDKRAAARSLLVPLELEKLSLEDRRAALRLRVALARTPVERLEQLAALRATLVEQRRALAADPDAAERAEARLEVVDRELSKLIRRAATAELDDVLERLADRPPSASIALELARRALDAGQLERAERRLARAAILVQTELEQSELRLLAGRLENLRVFGAAEVELPPLRELVGRPLPRTQDASGTLGVVLPLSGSYAEFGQASLRGILLAADLFRESDAEAPAAAPAPDVSIAAPEMGRRGAMKLLVRDSGADAAKAAAAVRELAARPEVVAILGPIFKSESLAAAEAAEREGVPLVTLAASDGVSEDRRQAFRTRTRPSDEVGLLVDHAFDALAAQRFAVLYPETRYGRGMRKLYWEAVTARGGKIVAASSYDPETVDFATAIRDMIGYRFLTHWEQRALDQRADILRSARFLEPEQAALLRDAAYSVLGPEGDPLPPIVDFDVLFIPDAADKISLIAPGLAFHEIRGVTLMGPTDWLDDQLLRVARQHVSGAIITTPFYPESDIPFVSDFVSGYRRIFAGEPDAYAAEAYDAANLVLVQLASGRNDRDGIRQGLLDTRAHPGATGVLTMNPDGNARRRPFLLRVSGRRFQPLD